jgi:hypothetical protein
LTDRTVKNRVCQPLNSAGAFASLMRAEHRLHVDADERVALEREVAQ